MSWPLSQDYNEAIQDPRNSFSDAELKTGEAAANALGIPMPRSGNFADVYEVRSANGGHWAVKCFTREVPGLLVDYDGMFVPALTGGDSGEVGHPCYQHPQRLSERTYSLEVDRFPLLLVATALEGIKVGGRALWDKYDSGDNLLFREADLRAPVKSRLFYELLKLGDERTSRLASRTLDALKGRLESTPLLEEVLAELHTPAAPKPDAATASPKRATIQATTAELAAAVQPAAEAAKANSAWDFEDKDKLPSCRRRKGGLLRWVECAAAVGVMGLMLAGGIVALGLWNGSEKPNDTARIAQNDKKQPQSSSKSSKVPDPKKPTDGNGQPNNDSVDPLPPEPKAPEPPDRNVPPNENKPDGQVATEIRGVFKTYTGDWKIEGNELVQQTLMAQCMLVFGDFAWTDYDFTAEVKSFGNNDIGLIYRATGNGFGTFVPGAFANKTSLVESWRPNAIQLARHPGGEIKNETWQTLRVSLRGAQCQCFVDDRLIHECADQANPRGAVGLRTWFTAARFKNRNRSLLRK